MQPNLWGFCRYKRRSSLLCVLSVFTHSHTQKYTQMLIFTAVSICFCFSFFPQACNSLTFYLPFFCLFLIVSVSAFLSNHPSVICILPFSFYTFLFLSFPSIFFPKSSKSWGSKHKSRRKSKKQRKSSTVCNFTLITTLKQRGRARVFLSVYRFPSFSLNFNAHLCFLQPNHQPHPYKMSDFNLTFCLSSGVVYNACSHSVFFLFCVFLFSVFLSVLHNIACCTDHGCQMLFFLNTESYTLVH